MELQQDRLRLVPVIINVTAASASVLFLFLHEIKEKYVNEKNAAFPSPERKKTQNVKLQH